MRNNILTALVALIMLVSTAGLVAAAPDGVTIGGDQYAEVDTNVAEDPFDKAPQYADYIVDNTDLEDCRSKSSITNEIRAHVVGANMGATDPVAGITCEVNYLPYYV